MELQILTAVVPGYLTDTMALAAVALIGYLFGHRTRKAETSGGDEKLTQELARAVQIAKELQQVAGRIRQELAAHQSSIAHFQSRIQAVESLEQEETWNALTEEAEALLGPTMKLSTNLSVAYDQLRQHTSQLMNFCSSRNDPETGVGNRRALEELLENQFTTYAVNKNRFSLAIFSIAPYGDSAGQDISATDMLRRFASILEHTARDTDYVARYSDEEFVVLMSHTTLAGASVFSERLLNLIEVEIACDLSGGLVEVQEGDTAERLFSRADSALYSARSKGGSCLYLHNGKALRQLSQETDPASEEATEPSGANCDPAPPLNACEV